MEIKSSFDELKEEVLQDAHREKAPSNKTPVIIKSTKWVFGLVVH